MWRCLVLAIVMFPLAAQSVEAVNGNIVFTDSSGRNLQLTSSGRDFEPSRSWDASRIVFLREIGQKDVDGEFDTEIWIADLRDQSPRTVVAKPPPRGFQIFSAPQFSRDNDLLYFASRYGVTVDAVWIYDLRSQQFTFICYGLGPKVIREGQYAGYEVDEIGESEEQLAYFLEESVAK